MKAEKKNAILMHVNKTYTATEIAKELGLKSATQLNKILEEKKIQYHVNGTWVMYSKYSNLGYEEIKQEVLDSGRGDLPQKNHPAGKRIYLEIIWRECGMKIINKINNTHVPKWGNQKKYIAIHYLGVDGQNNKVDAGGYGAHFISTGMALHTRQQISMTILWQVGTGGYYAQKHPQARNSNTIGIEMCCHCDGNEGAAGPDWWFTRRPRRLAWSWCDTLWTNWGFRKKTSYDITIS